MGPFFLLVSASIVILLFLLFSLATTVEQSTVAVITMFGKYQRVLRLYYLEEKSYEEVARLLEWPMGTVKVYLHRARKELAGIWQEAETRAETERRPYESPAF